jgi:glucose/arabinose dehydrogenase
MARSSLLAATLLGALALSACASTKTLPAQLTVGPDPTLPAPQKSLIPAMRTPKAESWAAGDAPVAPAGFTVTRFAEGLQHPRWLYVLPNGDVLVSLASTRPVKAKSIRDVVMNMIQKRVKATAPSPDQIVLLRDADGDGAAETWSVLIASGLNQPFGMALSGGYLYVGDTDALVRVPFTPGQTSVAAAPEKVIDLPHADAGHWTRNVLARPDGKLFVTVGSKTNIADEGMDVERDRAAIWEVDPKARTHRVYASGLRNANGLAFAPGTSLLYTVVDERDELGNDLVPDYLTSVREGAFYGWPWSYWGSHVDERVQPQNTAMVRRAIEPDYALGAHVAALGLAFYDGATFPAAYRGGAFVGEHGSWNRTAYSGYKVAFIPFSDGRPSGPPQDFLTGFFDGEDRVSGRPVGVAVARDGALLVADDVGGVVWRVAPR